jgi:REP element-mobilizing transposase RayT
VTGSIWQRSFYDHAMRTEDNLITTANYIVANPIRNKIVTEPSKYAYSWHQWMK